MRLSRKRWNVDIDKHAAMMQVLLVEDDDAQRMLLLWWTVRERFVD